MKVYIVLQNYGWEGCSVPSGVFSTLDAARASLTETQLIYGEIYEYEIDKGEGAEVLQTLAEGSVRAAL